MLTQFWLFALNISVCTDTKYQGNRYTAARNLYAAAQYARNRYDSPGWYGLDFQLYSVHINSQEFNNFLDCLYVIYFDYFCNLCQMISTAWVSIFIRLSEDVFGYSCEHIRNDGT